MRDLVSEGGLGLGEVYSATIDQIKVQVGDKIETQDTSFDVD